MGKECRRGVMGCFSLGVGSEGEYRVRVCAGKITVW